MNLNNIINKKFIILYFLPFISWIALIHFSSSQPYETQNVQPIMQDTNLTWVEDWFSWVSFEYGDTAVSLESRSPEAFIEFFLRKGAHVAAFAILGILAYRLVYYLRPRITQSAVISWLIVTTYAAIDETRQYFHPDRTGMVEDVILDSVSGILGILVIIGLRSRLQKQS